MDTPTWIEIASFSSIPEAYIAKGRLESEDIPVVINNATIASVYPMTDTWAPLQLLVPAELKDKALRILEK